MSTAKVQTFDVPTARLHYELRGAGPVVALVAAPMDATAFEPLADLLAADHTVLTMDPRGINRSPVHDPSQDSTPEMRADDLARLLVHLDGGPAAVFGSSGGAVTVLALAQSHPGLVHTVIAHEPPFNALVDDRDELRASTEDMIATYLAGNRREAWVKFLATANIFLPEPVFEAYFGAERDPQSAADERFQFEHMLRGTTAWEPEVEALAMGQPRIVVGIGEDSTGQLCDRTSRALAKALELEPTMFPGDHIGFTEDPASFATRLRPFLT